MNMDLTGASAKPKRKSRTEDDLPGQPKQKEKEEKGNSIADEILFYLVAECRNNMFPQRVNPAKLKLITEAEIAKFEKEKEESRSNSLLSGQSSDNTSEQEANKRLQENRIVEDLRESLNDDSPQSRMAIKTDSLTVKDYMKVLFSKITGKEENFIANLSSPLPRNPLEILMHLQNTLYELEEHELLPYQQTVLTVDIYLDIERSRKKVEEQQLTIERQKQREDHERLKAEIEVQKQRDAEKQSKANPQSRVITESNIADKLSSQLAEGPLNVRHFTPPLTI